MWEREIKDNWRGMRGHANFDLIFFNKILQSSEKQRKSMGEKGF